MSNKKQEILVNRKIKGEGLKQYPFIIMNPYPLIPKVVDKFKSVINDLKLIKLIPTDSISFSPQILSTFQKGIFNKGLSNAEITELLSVWSFFIIKGYTLLQIKFKFDEKHISFFDNKLKCEYDNIYFSIQRLLSHSLDFNEVVYAKGCPRWQGAPVSPP